MVDLVVSDMFKVGVVELCEVLELVKVLGVLEIVYCLNFFIVCGLDYYIGIVYEIMFIDYL